MSGWLSPGFRELPFIICCIAKETFYPWQFIWLWGLLRGNKSPAVYPVCSLQPVTPRARLPLSSLILPALIPVLLFTFPNHSTWYSKISPSIPTVICKTSNLPSHLFSLPTYTLLGSVFSLLRSNSTVPLESFPCR